MGAAALPPTPSGSGEADVARAAQVQHAIEHVDGDVHLGRPTLIRMRAQPVADHLFPSADGGLGPGAFRVPGRPLPGHATLLGNELEVAVALRRRTLGRLARRGSCTRRHDDGRLRVALADAGVNTVLVVSAIGRYKRVIGDRLRAHTDERRATEVDVAVYVLNRMLELGRPTYVRLT